MKKRTTLIVLALAATTATGAALAFGGPHRGVDGVCSFGGPGGERSYAMKGVVRDLPPEQRQAARERLRDQREQSLGLHQRLMNHRFEMRKLVQAEKWDPQAAEAEARKSAEVIAELMVQRAKLHHELRALGAAPTTP